jgi:hypothetical protein
VIGVNPEFRRNLWLELTPHRLLAMPLLLGLVLALVYVLSADKNESVAATAAAIAGGLLLIWGARSAGDSVFEEVRARTWDAQRMSAIGPWAMTWGKLFGAASFSWYGGLMALAVVLVSSPRGWVHSTTKLAALVAAAGLLAQAAACLTGLAAARKGAGPRTSVGAWLVVVLIVMLGPSIGFLTGEHQPVAWWGESYQAMNLVLASVACFAAWAVFGVYRSLCGELQVRTTPWAFGAFALFVTFYVAGFWTVPGVELAARGRTAVVLCGLLVCGTLTYVQLFSERTGVIVFRRVQVRLARAWTATGGGELRRALEELPCWTVGFVLTGIFCALGVAILPADAFGDLPARNAALVPLPLFLLLGRDVCVFLFFSFARQPRRVEGATMVYLVLLYGLLPWLLRAAHFDNLADLVLPPVLGAPGKSSAIAAGHFAVAAALVALRWRRYQRPGPPAPQG